MRRCAFTLIELLVVIAIIGLLMSVLFPAISGSLQAARNLKCMSQMRSAVTEFRLQLDDFAERSAGESAVFGSNQLKIEDFQEQLYRVDEFWDAPDESPQEYRGAREVMMCPAGPGRLQRRPGLPCSDGAVGPPANVSIAFNMRLFRATESLQGRKLLTPQVVNSRILDYPDVPLMLDVDGAAAQQSRELPYYTAPPTPEADHFQSGRFWFPALRHGGRLNAAMVGGAVLSSSDPARQPGWRWSYQPD